MATTFLYLKCYIYTTKAPIMKHTLYSAMLAFTLISFTTISAQATKSNLIGSWRLISSTGKDSGNSFHNDSSTLYQVKVITSTMFVLTMYDRKSDSLLASFQGPVTVAGNTYTESIEKSSAKSMLGLTFKYTSTVSGNKWRIEGGGNGLELVEEWIRID